jgi:hypothetical protein
VKKFRRIIQNPKDDTQRANLYQAEETFGRTVAYDRGMSASQARTLIAKVRRFYKIKPHVALHFVKNAGWWGMSMQYHCSYGKAVPPYTMFVNDRDNLDCRCVLHEMAHLIDAIHHGTERQVHGPIFCGIASWLYDRFNVIPIDAYQTILRRHAVRFRRAEECSPRALLSAHKRKGRQ